MDKIALVRFIRALFPEHVYNMTRHDDNHFVLSRGNREFYVSQEGELACELIKIFKNNTMHILRRTSPNGFGYELYIEIEGKTLIITNFFDNEETRIHSFVSQYFKRINTTLENSIHSLSLSSESVNLLRRCNDFIIQRMEEDEKIRLHTVTGNLGYFNKLK